MDGEKRDAIRARCTWGRGSGNNDLGNIFRGDRWEQKDGTRGHRKINECEGKSIIIRTLSVEFIVINFKKKDIFSLHDLLVCQYTLSTYQKAFSFSHKIHFIYFPIYFLLGACAHDLRLAPPESTTARGTWFSIVLIHAQERYQHIIANQNPRFINKISNLRIFANCHMLPRSLGAMWREF